MFNERQAIEQRLGEIVIEKKLLNEEYARLIDRLSTLDRIDAAVNARTDVSGFAEELVNAVKLSLAAQVQPVTIGEPVSIAEIEAEAAAAVKDDIPNPGNHEEEPSEDHEPKEDKRELDISIEDIDAAIKKLQEQRAAANQEEAAPKEEEKSIAAEPKSRVSRKLSTKTTKRTPKERDEEGLLYLQRSEAIPFIAELLRDRGAMGPKDIKEALRQEGFTVASNIHAIIDAGRKQGVIASGGFGSWVAADGGEDIKAARQESAATLEATGGFVL